MTISPFYDPLIAKVIVTGPTRLSAIGKLRDLLSVSPEDESTSASSEKFVVQGPPNNVEFLRCVLSRDIFVTGNATTEWVDSSAINFKPR